MTALSVERYTKVTDTKKRSSTKFKILIIILSLTCVWLFGIIFSLPIVLSFESKTLNNGLASVASSSCQTTWTDKQLNDFFFIKCLFIFVIPFAIILVSSVKLVVFLVRWRKKLAKIKISYTVAENKSLESKVNVKIVFNSTGK